MRGQIVDPVGRVLQSFGVEEEGILYGEIDLGQIEKERDFNTVLIDRHPEDYAGILEKWEGK